MRTLRRFFHDHSGVSAVEFAMIAPILLALVFSTLEAGWMMTRANLLDRALDISIRRIRTDAVDRPRNQPEMKTAICKQMNLVVPVCERALVVEMSTIKTAADIPKDAAKCVDRGTNFVPAVNFTTGDRADKMYVRACLVVDPITPLIGLTLQLSKDSLGGYSLVASSAFANEPGAQ